MSNISFFQAALIKAKETFEMESRRIKNGLMAEKERTVSRLQLNSLTATLAPPSESTVAPLASPAQNTTPNKQPHYTKTAKTFEQKQQLSSPSPVNNKSSDQNIEEDESSDDEEPTYQAERIPSVKMNKDGTEAESFEVKWQGFAHSQNTYELIHNLSDDLTPIGRDLAAKVPQV